MKAFVTGGAGFIGSHLVDALLNEGCKVTILDNLTSGSLRNIEGHLANSNALLVKGDVRDIRNIKEALTKVDTIFHLAAITSVPYSIKNPTTTDQVNAKGTKNLLEAGASIGIKRFINVSSCAVYGDPRYLPVDEDHPINPKSPYAESKIMAEKYCEEFQKKYGLETVTLRLFNVFGSRQGSNEYSGVITRFITEIRQGRPPIIYGDGEQTRDFVHVSDVVQALLLSMNSNKAIGQIFNIGSGKSVTIRQLCQLLLRIHKAEIMPIYKEPRLGDVRHSCAKIEKAHEILGYEPKVSLAEGLENLAKQTGAEL